MHQKEWQLSGRIAQMNDQIVGYTFGTALSDSIFCILAEITDPTLPGLGTLLFQEFCRRLESYPILNAMADEGIEGLRRAKQSYRPFGFAQTYVAEMVELKGFEPSASSVRLKRSPN